MNNDYSNINESINARNLATKELCDSFIINEYYRKLASPDHSIMMGPRGSGKTTLMRMLDVKSLGEWSHQEADYFRDNIKYTGVFIPTDRLWKRQYESILSIISNDKEYLVLLKSQFIYHVLEKIAHAIDYRINRSLRRFSDFKKINMDKMTESEMVDELSSAWIVKPNIKSIKSLCVSIANKKKEVSDFISDVSLGIVNEVIPNVIHGELTSVLNHSISIINTYFNDIDNKWVLLFDELELAPDEIIQPLIDNMRGGHENIILKLALSPYHKDVSITKDTDSAMKDGDIVFIDLANNSDEVGSHFAKELCRNLFYRNNIYKDFDELFDSPKDIDIDMVINSLLSKDQTFKEYLSRRNLLGLPYSEANDRQSELRKIKFLIYLRDYKKGDNNKNRSRRRASDFYAGYDNICKAVEYNPRMLIGIMNKFLPSIKIKGKVSIHEQLDVLGGFFDSYRSLLTTIAINSDNPDINNIYDLVDKIALYFKDEIYGSVFKSEPCTTIKLGNSSPEDLREAIGLAQNAGALINVSDRSQSKDLKNNGDVECRLSYLFSHSYGLLMTLGRSILLSTILTKNNVKVVKVTDVAIKNENHSIQLSLELK